MKNSVSLRLRELETSRSRTLKNWIGSFKSEMALRLSETRRIFGVPMVLFDPHTHSNHSDGRARVSSNREAAERAGLDFMFATDHATLRQKHAVRFLEATSWGQEPGAGGHHIGLLCPRKLFVPLKKNIAEDYRRAQQVAPFAWIPHPAGWFPRTYYKPERIEELWSIGNSFSMEVLNGAHKIFNAWDQFDREAVRTWDRLLSDGYRVTPLGGSDAHVPEALGVAWTAVPGEKATALGIISSLKAGRCLASEAALLDFTVDGAPMGSVISKEEGAEVEIAWRAVDSGGLQSVRLVSGGEILEEISPAGRQIARGSLKVKVHEKTYYRLESQSIDDRRAFASPVYLETRG